MSFCGKPTSERYNFKIMRFTKQWLVAKLFIYICLIGGLQCDEQEVEKFMKDIEIIPDILTEAPKEFLKIEYANGLIAHKGNELTPTQAKDAPKVDWTAEPDAYYSLIMSSADVPNRENPIWREWLHWLVVNIPGRNVDNGIILSPYIAPAAPRSSGLLRYVFLIYKQPGKLSFDEKPLNITSTAGHSNFSSSKFSQKYSMGPPVAGNVLQARWDEYVPTIHKMLNVVV